ncbi:dipeptidyl aminopeptidase/acylaminoacyl peptidase [Paraburkholderia sp. BL8N3]|jgi:dipeptidyl aminopeptidase/acylaminoacyl peptidase|nr:prolyl oligopeptidase family serine peptidase [Paraburkholderia sp. BL8N3]TCK36141.1 dipeptidyl aminopeptidase/acylaminoacyl peptidase [Paraburkholderia sp. BL8N3]
MNKTKPISKPYGGWKSPVTTDLIVGDTIRLGQPAITDDAIYWTEGRPQEQGRNVLVRHAAGGAADLVPPPMNVRTLAHEYGGGAYTVGASGVFFSNAGDQQIHTIDAAGTPRALTTTEGLRYADAIEDPCHRRLIAVCEDHRAGTHEPLNFLAAIDLDTGALARIADGHDFFSSPCLSPDGSRLAWLAWDHPDMPWDATQLWLADIAADGQFGEPRRVAAGVTESLFQPAWSPAGQLHVVSDRSGWWNLYRIDGDNALPLHPLAAEFARPQWLFGMTTYGFNSNGQILCIYEQDVDSHLALLDPAAQTFEEIDTPFCMMRDLHVCGEKAVFIGATPRTSESVIEFDLTTRTHRVLRDSSRIEADPAYTSIAQAICYTSSNGRAAHALYYPPFNADYAGPVGERPPLLVMAHGGPTSSTDRSFKWGVQFWTSRGFAVVDVNYSGSSGYGRAYREQLNGRWGVDDVDDAVAAALYLVDRGLVDEARLAVRGASAGGYLALSALTFRTCFKAGASHYGIGDLEALLRETHKFESHYLFRLVGKYPEQKALYYERSPVNHVDQLSCAMILFQGAEDKVVPPAQAESMYRSVHAKGLPVAYVLFAGEQHGFRVADNIRRCLEAELYFYGKIFGFELADAIEPVTIANIETAAGRTTEGT